MKPATLKKKEGSPSASVIGQKKELLNTTKGKAAATDSSAVAKRFQDKYNQLLSNCIGHEAIVTTVNGGQKKGILTACNLESNDSFDLVLKNPETVKGASNDKKEKKTTGETLLIKGDNVAELEFKDINLTLDWKAGSKQTSKVDTAKVTPTMSYADRVAKGVNKFRTDVAISKSTGPVERKLERWTPDVSDDATLGNAQTLEESSTTWDQFSVNEKKFGIKSTYDEHFYTTRINKDDPNYQQKLKEAQRLADEIEGQGTSGNIHIAEDRGIIIDDSGMDEEDLYSGVDRRGDELLASLKTNSKPSTNVKSNKYVPPTLRNQPHHMDPAIISSSTMNGTTTGPVTTNAKISSSTAGATSSTENNNKATTEPKDSKSNNENVKPINHLKNVDEDIKKQLKEIKRQSGRSDHSSKSRVPPVSKTSKEAQIEELKSFAQKFKVPYDVPKDMNDVLRKPSVSLKADPSLPPKPKSNTTSNTTVNKNQGKNGVATQGKNDSRKTDGAQVQSGSYNGSNNAVTNRSASHNRRRPTGSFFGSKKPQNNGAKKEKFGKNFNFFLKAKEAHDEEKSMEPFLIEKPYFAAPTWTSTIEESYKSLLIDQQTIIQETQTKLQMRQMNAMGGMGSVSPNMGGANGMNMMGFPMMNGPNGNHSGVPMANNYNAGAMGMYMPFQPQPMFYPSMGPMVPMMGNGKDESGNGGASPGPQDMQQQQQNMGPGGYMNVGGPYGYPMSGMAPFPGMMGQNGMMAGGDHRHKPHYHHKNNNNNHHHRNQ
ncbi:hypothetical protein C6P45_005499 [Maudiozyma exigua]|uniref:LsmAD domain-containing protein n=1 Tax=Maudiozyma exigua TaxID=34358 RepID=A0A9P7B9C2_MAUEX|nr:hypothetical protein C6P45_005499 [Kazachstania exigua]